MAPDPGQPVRGFALRREASPDQGGADLRRSADELLAAQRRFLDLAVLPRRMEISSLPVLGAVQHYQAVLGDAQPTAVIELDVHRTHVFILGKNGVNTPAPIEFGFDALVDTALKELGSEDVAGIRARLLAGETALVARAPRLLRQLIRNLKPAIDYFELQTGQRVNDLYCSFLPASLDWLAQALATALEMRVLPVDCGAWLKTLNITLADGLPARLGPHWLSLFSLIAPLGPPPMPGTAERVAGSSITQSRTNETGHWPLPSLASYTLIRLCLGSARGPKTRLVISSPYCPASLRARCEAHQPLKSPARTVLPSHRVAVQCPPHHHDHCQ